MKVYVLYKKQEGPYGGGNQFIKALAKYLEERGVLTFDIEDADVVIFNSFEYCNDVIQAKRKYPQKVFIHRVDGPCKLYNNMNDYRDDIVFDVNEAIADATVFQSFYSLNATKKLGYKSSMNETVIHNAVDDSIFFPGENKVHKEKIQIIASSFSDNWNKGFKDYIWLDDNLDFNKYEMVFVGRTPVEFKNIEHIAPVDSKTLADLLRENDIYITASKNDACPNSLLEAKACGLPIIALNSGGHPEIIGEQGELYNKIEEVPRLIKKIEENYNLYSKNIKNNEFSTIGEKYIAFIEKTLREINRGDYSIKRISFFTELKIKFLIRYRKYSNLIKR